MDLLQILNCFNMLISTEFLATFMDRIHLFFRGTEKKVI